MCAFFLTIALRSVTPGCSCLALLNFATLSSDLPRAGFAQLSFISPHHHPLSPLRGDVLSRWALIAPRLPRFAPVTGHRCCALSPPGVGEGWPARASGSWAQGFGRCQQGLCARCWVGLRRFSSLRSGCCCGTRPPFPSLLPSPLGMLLNPGCLHTIHCEFPSAEGRMLSLFGVFNFVFNLPTPIT